MAFLTFDSNAFSADSECRLGI